MLHTAPLNERRSYLHSMCKTANGFKPKMHITTHRTDGSLSSVSHFTVLLRILDGKHCRGAEDSQKNSDSSMNMEKVDFIRPMKSSFAFYLICKLEKTSPHTTSLCSASLADWPAGRSPIGGMGLISFNGKRSNSAHFFSISSSMRCF